MVREVVEVSRVVSVLLLLAVLGASGLSAGPEWAVTFTLSGAPFLGVELGWPLDDHTQVRAGLSLGLDAHEDTTAFVLWRRVSLVGHVQPLGERSPFIGGGLSALLAPIGVAPQGQAPEVWAVLEVPVGIRWPLEAGLSLLGELRLALPWLNPLFGKDIPAFVLPIGITAGLAF